MEALMRLACARPLRLVRSISTTRTLGAHATPVLAQKKDAPKKEKGGGAAAAPVETFDLTKVIPVNILKDGKDPEIKADSEYPPWVFTLTDAPPDSSELLLKGVENLTLEELDAVVRRMSKKRIKTANAASSKSG